MTGQESIVSHILPVECILSQEIACKLPRKNGSHSDILLCKGKEGLTGLQVRIATHSTPCSIHSMITKCITWRVQGDWIRLPITWLLLQDEREQRLEKHLRWPSEEEHWRPARGQAITWNSDLQLQHRKRSYTRHPSLWLMVAGRECASAGVSE